MSCFMKNKKRLGEFSLICSIASVLKYICTKIEIMKQKREKQKTIEQIIIKKHNKTLKWLP